MLSARARVVAALGVTQIVTWGASFYLLAILGGPIAAQTGWSGAAISAGVSLGLLTAGLAATRIGALIQRHGGRPVLSGGVALLAAGLCLLAAAPTIPAYLGAWVVMGLGMGASLYDAAFSTLGRLYGRDARAAITALTLWGGFASTVCWPLSAALVAAVGWRGACLAYAALLAGVILPLCWRALPAEAPAAPLAPDAPPGPPPLRVLRDLRFWCVAVAATVLAMLMAIWSVHLITIMTAQGLTLATAVALGALIGPAQVGARVLEMAGRGRHHPIWTMLVATTLVLLGFLGLLLGAPAAGALVAYGAGNGLWSIARGALPLAVFGPEDYPRLMGRIAAPALIASAFAPLLGAALIHWTGAAGALLALTLASIAPCVAAVILWRRLSRPL